ncbi:hypothetical protein HOY82DRAFT_612405 [Tuber indicum]|nr:hypothetical protein HOY82DRAFT_612405 [Tuber indicum]
MITGLVYRYTELNRYGNPQDDAGRIRRSLATGARSIRRMQVRTSTNAKIVYANDPGHSLLSIHQMENQIQKLLKKTDDHDAALTAEREARKAETERLEKQMDALTREVTMLRPLQATARIDDAYIIESGNHRAHMGDVILDVCLFKNHLISFNETFTALYGMPWPEAEKLLAEHQSLVKYTMLKGYTSVRLLLGSTQLVDAMNARATGLTNSRLGWSFEEEAQYRILINAILFM